MTESLPFASLKRQVYRIALPLLAVSVFLTFLLSQGRQDAFNTVVLPPLGLFLAITSVLIHNKKLQVEHIERAVYGSLVLVLIAKFGHSFYLYYQTGELAALVQIYIWTTVNFVLAYFLFEKRVALISTGTVFFSTLAIGVAGAILLSPPGALQFPPKLIDFYLANMVELGLLYGVANIRSRIAELKTELIQMEKIAHLDMLTGIPNRRQLELTLKNALSVYERYGSTTSVILLDIDRFKQINDTYGHDVGDEVLKTVARLFKDFLRDTDWLGRWGGEEFLVIASQTPLTGAMTLAERLRAMLAAHPFESVGQVTASFGVASFLKGDTMKTVTKRADEALYLAKEYGRDRVEAISSEPVEIVAIPELYCPFEEQALPSAKHIERLNRATIAWLSKFDIAPKKHIYRWVMAVNPGWLVLHIHPQSVPEVAQLISDWYLWLFLHDDRCDESALGSKPAQLEQLHSALLDVFRAKAGVEGDALSQLLADLARRFRKYGGAHWLKRFDQQLERYFQAIVWEANNRLGRTSPSLDDYLRIRPTAGAVELDSVLIEMANDVQLPAALQQDQDMQRLNVMAGLAVCLANDVYSLNKELQHEDMHNLVLLLQADSALSLEAALDKAVAMHDDLIRDFVQLGTTLKQEYADDDLAQYVTLLDSRIAANISWSRLVARYRPSALVRVTDQFTLTPPRAHEITENSVAELSVVSQ